MPRNGRIGSPGEVMQVAKQLFDIGVLFEHAGDFDAIRRTHDGVQAQESGYRQGLHDRNASLDDTLNASLGLTTRTRLRRARSTIGTWACAPWRRQDRGHVPWPPKHSRGCQRFDPTGRRSRESPCWHPCRGAEVVWGRGFRGCRCAQSPATAWQPSGLRHARHRSPLAAPRPPPATNIPQG